MREKLSRLMITIVRSSVSLLHFHSIHHNPTTFFHPYSHHLTNLHTNTSSPQKPLIINYLTLSLGFPKPKALSISKRFPWISTLDRAQSVVQFLKSHGFSDAQIRSTINISPQILFADVEKTLKPKFKFFQDLGVQDSDMGKFFSKTATLLTRSLDNALVPCVEFLKGILVSDCDNRKLIEVLRKCNWVANGHPDTRLKSNVSYLMHCGIFGSQLSMLLERQPWIFVMPESGLRDLVGKVLDMGFSIHSRMLVHALYTVSSMKDDLLMRKFELFQSFAFSEAECREMFRRTPSMFRTSEEKLKLGLQFYLNTLGFEKTLIVHQPTCLMYNMEDRVIPRYKVLQLMKSKGLLAKEPSFINVLGLPEDEFLDRFISRFAGNAEELIVAYKGHMLDSSEEEELKCTS